MNLMRLCSMTVVAAGLLAAACGGGGDGGGGSSTPPPTSGGGGAGGGSGGGGAGGGSSSGTVLIGQFKDSNVEGMDYRTPSRSGITNARGEYEHLAGEQVTFAVGSVELGSGPARSTFTPIDLGSDGGTDSVRTQNVARFLMMLDIDADPTNGVLISQAVRDMARNWQQVDFETVDLDGALVTIISDVASVDNRTPELPGAAAARAHLEATVYCTLSGIFQGNLSGSRTGPLTIVLRPTGQAYAIGVGAGVLLGPPRPAVDRERGFELTGTSDGATVRAVFTSEDAVSGTWSIGSESGQFSAARQFGRAGATWRFTGFWSYNPGFPDVTRQNAFDLDASGNITAWSQDTSTGRRADGQGRRSGDVLQVNWDTGASGTGTLDPDTLYVEGTWSGGQSGRFEADGCRLN